MTTTAEQDDDKSIAGDVDKSNDNFEGNIAEDEDLARVEDLIQPDHYYNDGTVPVFKPVFLLLPMFQRD